MSYVIATSRNLYNSLPENLQKHFNKMFTLINQQDDLNLENIRAINPRYIFFPHWSYKIPAEIYENFECIIFHMTDVPFGRGGSPLQNLIEREIYETNISALRCAADIDAGPVYYKNPFSLYGSAEEIYLRAAKVIEKMIVDIVKNEPNPTDQEGEIVYFKRRKPEDGNIAALENLEEVFDYIRMLDAENYPKAFIEIGNFRFEFQRACLKQGKVISDVIITCKEEKL